MYAASSYCDNGEWMGVGTAFLVDGYRNGETQIDIWVTADHITYLQDYDPRIRGIETLVINGTHTATPLQRHPRHKWSALMTDPIGYTVPITRWRHDGNKRFSQGFKVGEQVVIPFTTLIPVCENISTYENLFANCIYEFRAVTSGEITSPFIYQNMPHGYMGDIVVDAHAVSGGSGAPYMKYVPFGNDGMNVSDFRLLAVHNASYSGVNNMGVVITEDDYLKIEEAVKNLLNVW